MHISFSPYAALPGSTEALSASVDGDVLTVDGDTIDFAVLGDGDRIVEGHSIHVSLAGPVERVDGVIRLTLRLPYGDVDVDGHVEAPPAVTVAHGPVPIPPIVESE